VGRQRLGESRERELAAATAAAALALGRKVYGVIYADPPWNFVPYADSWATDEEFAAAGTPRLTPQGWPRFGGNSLHVRPQPRL
jgi:hypothetical protein